MFGKRVAEAAPFAIRLCLFVFFAQLTNVSNHAPGPSNRAITAEPGRVSALHWPGTTTSWSIRFSTCRCARRCHPAAGRQHLVVRGRLSARTTPTPQPEAAHSPLRSCTDDRARCRAGQTSALACRAGPRRRTNCATVSIGSEAPELLQLEAEAASTIAATSVASLADWTRTLLSCSLVLLDGSALLAACASSFSAPRAPSAVRQAH